MKFKCFGTANMSDECSRCQNNEACVVETIRKWKDRVKWVH